MKNTILLFIILGNILYLSCENPFLSSDQNFIELSQISSVKKIHFINSNIGWAIGNNGNLLQTKDGGKNWEKINFPNDENLIAIKFVNEKVGWISTEWAVYKTSDSGRIWTVQIKDSTLSKFNKIDFTDTLHGWVTGPTNGSLYKTENGGSSWTLINVNTVGRIVDIHFLNHMEGWIVSAGGKIFKTRDSGISWEKTTYVRFAWKLNLLDNNTCFVGNNIYASSLGNDSANIYRTDDGGKNWKKQEIPKVDAVIKIHFENKNTGFAICDIHLCYTDNGGNQWNKLNLNNDYAKDIAIGGDKIFILTQTNRILNITNVLGNLITIR
jgi:photosystem II stability/assembly factor-like uncharacterized protein